VRFPGSRFLHGWDLTHHFISLDDLLRSCQQVGLTGFAELKLSSGSGLIFYYLGAEVSAVYRRGPVGHHGAEAFQLIREALADGTGSITVHELPLEMAHALRGATNRRRVPDSLRHAADVDRLLDWIKKTAHTGTIEINADPGGALLIVAAGRIANMYWDAGDGVIVEKEAALVGLHRALRGEDASVYVSDFSPEAWTSRHETQSAALRSLRRGDRPSDGEEGSETTCRRDLLAALEREVSSTVEAVVFDLMTGVVLARRIRGTSALRVALLSAKLPALTLYVQGLVAAENEDEMEAVEIRTGRVTAIVASVPETREGVAVIIDKIQPSAVVASALARHVREYVAARQGAERASA
jgi:hypothetical protein